MSFKNFWEWLVTSRAYRLLAEQNKHLQTEIAMVREDNKRLTLALSPTLRALQEKSPAVTATEAADAPERESEPPRPRPRTRLSWRQTRAQLEFNESSQARRIEQIKIAHRNLP